MSCKLYSFCESVIDLGKSVYVQAGIVKQRVKLTLRGYESETSILCPERQNVKVLNLGEMYSM